MISDFRWSWTVWWCLETLTVQTWENNLLGVSDEDRSCCPGSVKVLFSSLKNIRRPKIEKKLLYLVEIYLIRSYYVEENLISRENQHNLLKKYLNIFQVSSKPTRCQEQLDLLRPFLQSSLTVHIAEHTTHSHSSSLLVLVYVVQCRL